MLIAFNRPFWRRCANFAPSRASARWRSSSRFSAIYPAGRLDSDSEGLLLLTDDGAPAGAHLEPALQASQTSLGAGGRPSDGGRHCHASQGRGSRRVRDTCPPKRGSSTLRKTCGRAISPIRYRAKISTSWIELTLREGKNRQVRRMTARVGFPTLRLVRASIGDVRVQGLALGEWREIDPASLWGNRNPRSRGRLGGAAGVSAVRQHSVKRTRSQTEKTHSRDTLASLFFSYFHACRRGPSPALLSRHYWVSRVPTERRYP